MKTKIFLFGLLLILANFVYSQTIPSNVPTNGLVGWWPFNGNANDESGNGNHGTAIGASLTVDRFGSPNAAFSLNGVNQMLEFPNMTELNVDTFSVSFYTLPNSYNIHNKVNFGVIASAMRFTLNFSTTTISYSPMTCAGTYAASGNWSTQGGVGLGDWHHLVYVIKGNTSLFFIDGILIEQLNNASNLSCFNSNMLLYFGGDIGGGSIEYYNGKFDDIGIWNRALSANEISLLYNSLCDTTLASFLADTVSSCGMSVELSTSLNFSSYFWNTQDTTNNILATETGWYSCQVTDSNACVYEDSAFVSLVSANILQMDTTICLGQSLQLSVEDSFSINSSSSLSGSLTNSLMGWWPFNGNANDESGNGNNGTVNGATMTIDRYGNVNSAYYFDGIDDNIITNSFANLSGDFTFSCWVKSDDNSNQVIVNTIPHTVFAYGLNPWYGGMDNIGFLYGNGASFGWYNNYYSFSNPIPYVNYWVNHVIKKSGATWFFYQNNSLIHTYQASNQPTSIISKLVFGHCDTMICSEPFSGIIDDIAIWNRALSPAEIEQLYSLAIPLTYSWSTGDTTALISVSPAETTTYYCTVNNGISSCVDSVLITISQPNVELGPDITVCEGTPYLCDAGIFNSYFWSTGDIVSTLNILTPGLYSVTVTDTLGCENSDSLIVSNFSAIDFSIGSDTIICPEFLFYLNAGQFYSYQWSNGDTSQTTLVSQAGFYSVTVYDDNLCRAIDTVEVVHFPSPVVDLGDDLSICEDQQISLTCNPGFVSYHWSNGNTVSAITVNTIGNYSLTVTDINGCEGFDEITLIVLPFPAIILQPNNQIGYLQDDATYSVTAANVTSWQWQSDIGFGFQNLSNAGQYSGVTDSELTISNLTISNDGQLFRCILGNQQCMDTSSTASLQVRNEVGMTEMNLYQVVIYPNPAKDEFIIEIDPFLQGKRYKIINLFGEEVKNGELSDELTIIQVSNLSVGAYILMILNDPVIFGKILIK